jgi:hypothetical protein
MSIAISLKLFIFSPGNGIIGGNFEGALVLKSAPHHPDAIKFYRFITPMAVAAPS